MKAHAEIDATVLARLEDFLRPTLRTLETQGRRPLARMYVEGLLGPGERKTVAPIAQRARGVEAAPAFERRMRAMLSDDDWNHRIVLRAGVHELLDRTMGWSAYTLDDTAILKQGGLSVGVANQYAGCIGGLANCQVLVTFGLAQEHVSAPCFAQLFLPEQWADDPIRRRVCHVPTTVTYRPKWQLGLDMVDEVLFSNLPRLPLLADSLYGDVVAFRVALQAKAYPYVVGISLKTTVWSPGMTFVPRSAKSTMGRPIRRQVPSVACAPKDVTTFAATLPAEAWQTVCWRDGSRGRQWGRFAAVRVRPAHGWESRGVLPEDLLPEEWLLIHWPEGEPAPTKAWFSNLPPDTDLVTLIQLARLRWRIERDYQEGKGLAGLDHYEGRSWQGLHHHVALVMLAQQFLATERAAALGVNVPGTPPIPEPETVRPNAATDGPDSPCSSPSTAFSP